MDGAQQLKRARKRTAKDAEAAPQVEDAAAEQSAGITQILKRFRNTQKAPGEAAKRKGRPAENAALPAPSEAVGAAALQDRELGADGAEAAAAAGIASEEVPLTAAQHQGSTGELPHSQGHDQNGRADDAEDGDQAPKNKKKLKHASDAVLPWMRLPVSIEAGQGVQLNDVGGLDPRLRDKMRAGVQPPCNISADVTLLPDARHAQILRDPFLPSGGKLGQSAVP